jgi:hypothetical protein
VEWARRLGGYDAVQAQIQAMPNWSTGFANGRIAMAAQTSAALAGNLKTFPDLAVQGGLFPGAQGVKPGEATWLSGRGVGVVTGAADLDSAWTFVKWLGATKEGTLAAVNRIGATPGLQTSPGLAVLEKDPSQKPFVEALRAARHNPPGALLPINVWAGERATWVRDALQQKIPARRALDEVTRTAQLELDEARAREKR